VSVESFAALAVAPDAPLDELALALAAEFRPVNAPRALDRLDRLAAEVDPIAIGPQAEIDAVVAVLAGPSGFIGEDQHFDAPDDFMLDLVLDRRRGRPSVLSVVYVEVARRAGIALAPIGLGGNVVCCHVGAAEALFVDPFGGGRTILPGTRPVTPWTPHQTALTILDDLVCAWERRGDLTRALRASELRLLLPAMNDEESERHARSALALRARLN
jgi:hypothetical protein